MLKRAAGTLTAFSHPPTLGPRQAEKLSTTELLAKLGFIAQPNAGLTNWLPLGKQVLDNVSQVIKSRHEQYGCVEVALSSLSHSSLWQKTGRWENGELFKLNDDFCLAATAEEEITQLVNHHVDSYKKLPLVAYQLTRKYRNEKRARGGLLRGREFVMKDAYSFDASKEEALASFERMNELYRDVFDDLKLPWVKANADSGDIGGDLSYEWHIVAPIGEDTIVECQSCHKSSNVERATGVRRFEADPATGMAKESNVAYHLTKTGELVCIYWPKDRKLSMKFVKEEDLVDLKEGVSGEAAIEAYKAKNEAQDGLLSIFRVVDANVGPGTIMPDMPVTFSRNRMVTFDGLDLTEMQEGDCCGDCGGMLAERRGVEVGHTFYLGTKYSGPMNATFVDRDGTKKVFEMGCYGIGVSRIVGVIAEIMRDEVGLRWPARVAPLQVSVIPTGPHYVEAGGKLAANLSCNVELDDSTDIGFGKKLAKSKMCGVPLQVIVGKRYPHLEIEVRGQYFTKKWEKVHASGQYDWVVEEDKHIVHEKDAAKVIDTLLHDL